MRLTLPILLSVAYVVFVIWSVSLDKQDLESLELNELGDFLAGIIGPLAILWLVTGVFLQSKEMGLNTIEVRRARLVAEESNALKVRELSESAAEVRRKIRSGYLAQFVYIDHDDAGLLRPPHRSEYVNQTIPGIYFAEISRDRIVFSVRNFGESAELVKVTADDLYRDEMPFSVTFLPTFRRYHMLTASDEAESIRKISSGSRYQIVFDFDKSLEPRLQTGEQVDFEGSIFLTFDMNDREGTKKRVTQEVEYMFMFDEGGTGKSSYHFGIADDSILKFHPPSVGTVDINYLKYS
jgi:hypothetical protein